MRFGAHVSKTGKPSSVLDTAQKFGMTAVQFCMTSPVRMAHPVITFDELNEWDNHPYRSQVKVYVHAPYVLNFVDSGRVGQVSRLFIKSHMNAAYDLGAEGCVVHCGSWKGRDYQDGRDSGRHNLAKILEGSRGVLLIENMASGIERSSVEVIQDLLEGLPKERTGICFDTAHAYGAGIPMETKDHMLDLLDRLDSVVKLIHLNDVASSVKFGGGLDRHADFGRLEVPLNRMFHLFSGDFVIERSEDFVQDLQKMTSWAGEKVLSGMEGQI